MPTSRTQPIPLKRKRGPRLSGTPRGRLIIILASVPVVFLLLQHSGLLDREKLEWLSPVAWILISGATAARSLLTAYRATIRAERLAWTCFTLAAASWFIGVTYEAMSAALLDSFVYGGVTARILYILYPPLFATGVHLLTSAGSQSLGLVHRANLGMIGSAMFICAMLVLLDPIATSTTSSSYVISSIADMTLLLTATMLALISLWSGKAERLRPVVALLGVSAAIHAAVNIAFYYRVFAVGTSGISFDVVWLIALLLQYWAAFEHDNAPAVTRGASHDGMLERYADAVQAILPAALMLGMLGLMAIFYAHLNQSFAKVAVVPAALFVFSIGLREWGLDRHSKGLMADLQDSYALQSHVLNASPGVIFICEARPGYRMSYISENGRTLFGIDLANFDWQYRVHAEDRDLVRDALQRTMKMGSSSAELRVRDAHNRWRWVDQRLVLKHDEDGNPAEIVGAIVDIDERKELQSSVEQNQRLESLGQLSGSIAHDFNNLLTSILGFASLLLGSRNLSATECTYVKEIQTAGERGAALTNQLLSFSRRHTFSVDVIDLNDLITDMSGMLHRLLGDQAQLEFRPNPTPIRVKGSKNRLEQVLMNLVINARDAMPDGGRILIDVREVKNRNTSGDSDGQHCALISVADEGVGVDEKVRAQMFDPFFTTKDDGTGLGLATVHSIVTQHNGHVEVHSRRRGGTRFAVYLPATRSAQKTTQPQPQNVPCGSNERILVVDDEVSITRVISNILAPLGYRVFVANDLESALRIAYEEPFDLLLSDIVMPKCDGHELRRKLQKIRDFKVVYMSGYTDAVLARQVWDGETPLLQKPLVVSQLAAVLRECLDQPSTRPVAEREMPAPR